MKDSCFIPFNRRRCFPVLLFLSLMLFAGSAFAERIFFAGYKDGFYIKSEEEGGMELKLGGSFQTDYRYYAEDERGDNGFDIRRARLAFRGKLTKWFRFKMEYEFEGNETDNLVDAYGEAVFGLNALRFGQFKEPFSLEWQTKDKAIFFAERSMGYSLSPKRDIGLMFHGSAGQGIVNYAGGLFNGDGDDGDTRGEEHDTLELAGRVVFSPFRAARIDWLDSLQAGFSATYAEIDTINVNLKVKTTGMAATNRSIYTLTHNTKFGVLQDAEDRIRLGAEAAWAWGPLAVTGEYVKLTYKDLKPAGRPAQDADFSTWYASIIYSLTGEEMVLSNGVMKPLYPSRNFNPSEGTFGALCLALRFEHFTGDEDWINPEAHVSVADADGISVALNWILFPMVRVITDYSRTEFSDPIIARRLYDGGVDYIDKENVLTVRFAMDF